MLKLCVYVPVSHTELVKSALFASGAGRVGDYDSCCWQVQGQGQFRPLQGAQPFIGQTNCIEQVDEYRIELLVPEHRVKAVLKALRNSHPYEEPAFDLVQLIDPAVFE